MVEIVDWGEKPEVKLKLRRGTSTEWSTRNPILSAGEPGLNLTNGWFKLGNGTTRWNDLDYFIDQPAIALMVETAVEEAIEDLASGGGTDPAVNAHINDDTPHPVYDDGPSLMLLYENAKV